MNKRNKMFPNARVLLDDEINLVRQFDVHGRNPLYGIKFNDKGVLEPIYNPAGNNTSGDPIQLKASLFNRYNERKTDEIQMNCLLYGQISPMEQLDVQKLVRVRIAFRSNCMQSKFIKYFLMDDQSDIPRFLDLRIGQAEYTFEYSNKSTIGVGLNKRIIYDKYRFLNFFIGKVRKPDITKDQKLGVAVPKDELELEIEEDNTESNKTPVTKLSLLYTSDLLPFKETNDLFEILPLSPQKPFWDLDFIKDIWRSNNPANCEPGNKNTVNARGFSRNVVLNLDKEERFIICKI